MRRFRNRREAGRVLGERLSRYAGREDVVVLALPRGGVPVGYEVARALGVPLDVFVVRKLGVPGREELALGAVASGGVRVLNDQVVAGLRLGEREIEPIVKRELAEVERRERAYRGGRPPLELERKVAILVDDGLATGATMRAAALAVRQLAPQRVVAAVPVAAGQTCDSFRADVDELVCASTPDPFYAVGAWYEDFAQTDDAEVRELLQETAPA
jgi:predicted phosphoribosyltransferase